MSIFETVGNKITALSDALGFERRDLKKDFIFPYDYIRGNMLSRTFRWDFSQIDVFCMFVGYPRSGHTLVGSLLDAHPDIVISHEMDVLRYLRYGFSKKQILSLIIHKDKAFTGKGREWSGYDYQISGLWQGHYRALKVIGDKEGSESTRQLMKRPDLLKKVRTEIDYPLRLIHIVRHPLDNITTHYSKKKPQQTLQEAIDDYFCRVETNDKIRQDFNAEEWFEMKHETIVEKPKVSIGKMVRFLGVEPNEAYLTAAANKVFKSPHNSRNKIEWPEAMIKQVEERSRNYEFLKDYSYTI
mgnify:FL=1